MRIDQSQGGVTFERPASADDKLPDSREHDLREYAMHGPEIQPVRPGKHGGWLINKKVGGSHLDAQSRSQTARLRQYYRDG